jgi:hypothetical protein
MTARPEVEAGVVFRLGRRDLTERFFPNGPVPDTDDFGLSELEKIDAQKLGGKGSLSVWDASITTPEEANAFLESPQKTRIVLDLEVKQIRELPHNLHIFREAEEKELPGRDGHCVIENVWSVDKRIRKAIQSDLVTVSRVRGTVGPNGFKRL